MRMLNLPGHWKTARLGEVTDIFKGGTPKRSVEKYFEGDILGQYLLMSMLWVPPCTLMTPTLIFQRKHLVEVPRDYCQWERFY